MAALTMVYRSPTILAKWVQHYAALLGRENLFIVSHGSGQDHEEVAAGCNHLVVPRESVNQIGGTKAAVLSSISAGLLAIYEGVVCGDADELIVLDPERSDQGLSDYILSLPKDAVVAPLGFNIMPESEYFDGARRATIEAPLLRQVNRAIFDADFSKPCVLKRPVVLSIGQHGLMGSKFSVDTNLVLIHLKYFALNSPLYYSDLSTEVQSVRAAGGIGGSHLWAAGLAGLREDAAAISDSGSAIPVLEPKAASAGCFSFDLSKLSPGARIGAPFRVVQEMPSPVFALPERWLDLV